MLIHCTGFMQTVQNAAAFGIHAKVESIDWQFIAQRAFEEVDADAAMIERGNRQSENVEVFKGRGRFTGSKALAVEGFDEELTAETTLIAAGTRPWVPDISGLDQTPYLTSDEALRLPEQPKHLTVVGGGYIVAELAHFFGALGTEVYQRRFNMVLDAQVERVSTQGGEITVEATTPDGKRSIP